MIHHLKPTQINVEGLSTMKALEFLAAEIPLRDPLPVKYDDLDPDVNYECLKLHVPVKTFLSLGISLTDIKCWDHNKWRLATKT